VVQRAHFEYWIGATLSSIGRSIHAIMPLPEVDGREKGV
jgi:hypothetical protein